MLKAIVNHWFIIVLFKGAVGVRGVDEPVAGDGGGRVVDLEVLLCAIAIGAMGFFNARGPSVPVLDLCQCPFAKD